MKSVSTAMRAISDLQFRVGVGAIGVALVGALLGLQLCADQRLPDKPPPPVRFGGASSDLEAKVSATRAAYEEFIARDAAAAGIPAPPIGDVGRKLAYRVEEARHVLEVGEPPIELAGMLLRALRTDNGLALEVTNAVGADLAYLVATSPIGAARCGDAVAQPFNAMVLGHDRREVRTECGWRDGISLAITRVETLELPPLAVWYVNHVAPTLVGVDPRVAAGHRPDISDLCRMTLPQAVRSGLERGEIGWRDLVDFFARHRCQTYRFPIGYRAFKSDNERPLPAVVPGM